MGWVAVAIAGTAGWRRIVLKDYKSKTMFKVFGGLWTHLEDNTVQGRKRGMPLLYTIWFCNLYTIWLKLAVRMVFIIFQDLKKIVRKVCENYSFIQ